MKRCTYMAFDASNEKLVRVSLRILYEIGRCLFSRDCNKRDTFVRRLKPDDLWALDRSTTGFFGTVTFSFASLGLLLFFCRKRRWTEKT